MSFVTRRGKESRPLRIKYYAFLAILVCASLLNLRDAHSCDVPVFRYALERWKPDAYKGIYLYRDEISKKDRELLDQLKAASNAQVPLNLVIHAVDVNSFSKKKLTELLQGPVPDTLPVLKIWYPEQMGKKPPVWSEKLTPSLVKDLLQSPKRKQMAESLINGDSIVWVFIPSGNEKKDEEAKAVIGQELNTELIAYSKMPYTVMSGDKQIKLSYGFPILTLSRHDPAERIFVDSLMKIESDLYEHTNEPMVFPVFGRGRALGCLFGKYITAEKIRSATAFLSGACSCEVKNLNPGMDLLVAAPWDMVVMNSFVDAADPMPELTGVMPDPKVDKAQKPENPSSPPPKVKLNPEGNASLFQIYAMTLLGVIVLVVIAGFIISGRRRNK